MILFKWSAPSFPISRASCMICFSMAGSIEASVSKLAAGFDSDSGICGARVCWRKCGFCKRSFAAFVDLSSEPGMNPYGHKFDQLVRRKFFTDRCTFKNIDFLIRILFTGLFLLLYFRGFLKIFLFEFF